MKPGVSDRRTRNLKEPGVFSQCRAKDSLDIFWLSDESLEESDNLPDPDVLGPGNRRGPQSCSRTIP